MPAITTEYRGYTISYSENADEWNCYDCGVSHANLSKVKAKIDALHLKMRKASAVACLEVSDYGSERVTPAILTDYLGPKYERPGWSDADKEPKLIGHKVAAMAKRDGNERQSRRERELSNFAPDTPEVRAAIANWLEMKRLEDKAEQRRREAFEAIPRLKLEDIDGLVKASSAQIEETAED